MIKSVYDGLNHHFDLFEIQQYSILLQLFSNKSDAHTVIVTVWVFTAPRDNCAGNDQKKNGPQQ